MLSDCEKCWETPCSCGWEYRNWDIKRLIRMRDMLQDLIYGVYKYSKKDLEERNETISN